MTRIYRVASNVNGTARLVRAHSQAQAVRHVVADQYVAAVASQEEIVELLAAGEKVLDATREAEPAGKVAEGAPTVESVAEAAGDAF